MTTSLFVVVHREIQTQLITFIMERKLSNSNCFKTNKKKTTLASEIFNDQNNTTYIICRYEILHLFSH